MSWFSLYPFTICPCPPLHRLTDPLIPLSITCRGIGQSDENTASETNEAGETVEKKSEEADAESGEKADPEAEADGGKSSNDEGKADAESKEAQPEEASEKPASGEKAETDAENKDAKPESKEVPEKTAKADENSGTGAETNDGESADGEDKPAEGKETQPTDESETAAESEEKVKSDAESNDGKSENNQDKPDVESKAADSEAAPEQPTETELADEPAPANDADSSKSHEEASERATVGEDDQAAEETERAEVEGQPDKDSKEEVDGGITSKLISSGTQGTDQDNAAENVEHGKGAEETADEKGANVDTTEKTVDPNADNGHKSEETNVETEKENEPETEAEESGDKSIEDVKEANDIEVDKIAADKEMASPEAAAVDQDDKALKTNGDGSSEISEQDGEKVWSTKFMIYTATLRLDRPNRTKKVSKGLILRWTSFKLGSGLSITKSNVTYSRQLTPFILST